MSSHGTAETNGDGCGTTRKSRDVRREFNRGRKGEPKTKLTPGQKSRD